MLSKLKPIILKASVFSLLLFTAPTYAQDYIITEDSYFPTTKEDIIRALKPQPQKHPLQRRIPNSRGITVQYPELPKISVPEARPKVQLRINFAFGSSELSDTSKFLLYELSQALKSDDLKEFKFLIGGHTDSVGSAEANKNLSKRRAAAVKSYLTKTLGVDATRLSVEGKGEETLLDPYNPKSFVNRRVEVTNLGKAD